MKNTLFVIALIATLNSSAQEKKHELTNQANLLFGVSQLALDGFNLEGNLFYKRLAFDYSHGISLNFSNASLENGNDKTQNLAIHIPWTTGFGLGYRFTDWLNLRVEPKWHKYELYYDGMPQQQKNRIIDYTTFTLGLGLYTNIRPFKNQDNFLKGIMIAPNVRWWPKISSSLSNDEHAYFNSQLEKDVVHQAREIGMGNTPFFVNMSIGYSVQF